MKKQAAILLTAALLGTTALGSVAYSSVGEANAYFTTYVQASGSKQLHFGDNTTISEGYQSWNKTVKLTNDASSPKPVYMRVKAFCPDKYYLERNKDGASEAELKAWDYNEKDGYWYYQNVVQPGETTSELTLTILDAATNKKPAAEKGLSFNVILIYETTPAVEDGDGKYESADWSQSEKNSWKFTQA